MTGHRTKRSQILSILVIIALFGAFSSYVVSGIPTAQENMGLAIKTVKENRAVNETAGQIVRIYRIASNQRFGAVADKIAKNESGNQIDGKIHRELREHMKKHPKETVTVLVQLKNERDLDRLAEAISKKGGNIKGKHRIGDVITADIPADRIEEIASDSSVEGVWPNRIYYALLDESVPRINAPVMWDSDYNGGGIKIAILDTGIDTTHPMLEGKVILEAVFTGEDHTYDVAGHGTHVAGTAAGRKVSNESYNGVAPGALLFNAKVLDDTGSGDDIGIISAINWAVDPDGNSSTDDGADIISMSLGGPYSDLNSPILSAIRDAVDTGVVVVVAVGNCGSGCPGASCGGYVGVSTPGNSPEAISVGAVDGNNQWACFSSGGYVNGTIKPDVVAPGVDINSSIPGGGYASWGGTSMATPHVAGAAALLLQSNRNLTPEQVKYIIERTSMRLGEPGKDIKYGSGLIDASKFIPPNVNKLLKYRLTFLEAIYRSEPLDILVNSTSEDIVRINATVIDPTGVNFTLNFVNMSSHAWNATFLNTSELGRYNLGVSILNTVGNVTVFNEEFDVIRYNLTDGIINDIIILPEIAFNETLPIEVIFENIGNTSLDVLVDAQILHEGSLIDSIESERTTVNASTIMTFNLTWTANAPLGTKTLKAIASYEGEYYIKEKNFTIIDNSTPIITNVTFYNISINNPALIEVEIRDLSDLHGNITIETPSTIETVELEYLFKINDINTLAGTYENTTEPGQYTFNITICDSVGFCNYSNQYSFDVADCSNPHILVVSEQEESSPERFVDALNDSYCISVWDKSKSGVPALSYLDRFEGVIWTTGNYFGDNIDENSSNLLLNYSFGGNIVLEGPDIGFEHRYDEFMENVTHSIFDEDLIFPANKTNTSMVTTYNHPIFKNLPTDLLYNISLSPYPDSVEPANGGVELARWVNKKSAVVASNQNGSKTLFLPFMMDALNESVQDNLIRNIADWMVIDESSADLVVGNISYGYLVEGVNSLSVNVENNGAVDAINAKVDVFVDDIINDTVYTSVAAGSNVNLISNLALTPGIHTIKIELNSDFGITEQNHLNNIEIENVSVATIEADLLPTSISSDMGNTATNISVQVENVGGTIAGNFSLEVWIEDNLFATEYTAVDYGETTTVSVEWPTERGMFDVVVAVNPDRDIVESNYSNNNISSILYVCSKSRILIVNDNDANDYSTDSPSSAGEFNRILKNNEYCTDVWDESEKGTPDIEYLNQFDAIIWSAGDYWNTVINESDMALLEQYNGSIIFEGSDIAFDHINDTFMQNYIHSVLDRDLILDDQTEIIPGEHEILGNISNMSLNKSLGPYPDSLLPTDGTSIANWSNANSAIIVYNDSEMRMVYFGFSIDSINDSSTKEKLVINSVEWLLTTNITTYDISLNQGWNMVSIPFEQDNWSVDAVLSSIEGNYTAVYAYIDGSWKFTTARNPLTGMDLEHGYWIEMTAPDTLELTGTVPPATTINITTGWNLVGYPSLTTRNITDVLAGINYTSVYAYIDGSWKFTTARNPLTEMTPDYGYWIDSNEAASYEVS